jgi:hypothetical protein
MVVARALVVATVTTATMLGGCAAPGPPVPRAAVPLVTAGALDLDPGAVDPALRDRLAASPMAYFRIINVPFANEVCRLGRR